MHRSVMLSLTIALTFGSLAAAQDAPADPPRDPMDEEVEGALDSQELTLSFDETPLDEVAGFLRDVTHLNIVLHPALPEHAVTLELERKTLRQAVEQVLAGSGAEARVWCGALVLVPAGTDLGTAPRLGDDEAGKRLTGRKVTLNFPETPMPDVLMFVQDVTGVEVEVAPDAEGRVEELAVDLRVRELPLAHALTLATHLNGLTWRTTDAGTMRFELRPEPTLVGGDLAARLTAPASIDARDKDLTTICAMLQASTRVRFKAEGVPAKPVRVTLEALPLSDLLDILARMTDTRWSVEGDVIVVRPGTH